MKKIVAIICVCMMISSTAFASSINLPSFVDGNEDVVILSGTSDLQEGKKLTVSVFPEGKTYNDIVSFGTASEIPSFAGVTESLVDGGFEINWIPQISGYYDIYLSGDGVLINNLKKVYIPTNSKCLYDVIRTGTPEEICNMLSLESNRMDLLRNKDVADSINPETLGIAIYNMRSKAESSVNTGLIINAGVKLQLLSQNKTSASLDEMIEAIGKIGLNFADYSNYTKYADDSIKADMASDMSNVALMTFDELDSFFSDRIVLSGVYKSLNWMDGLEFLNMISYPELSKSEKAAIAVTGTKYESVEALKKAIDKAVLTSVQGSNGGGSSGGGFSGGGSSGGGSGKLPVVAGGLLSDKSLQTDVGKDVESAENMDDIFEDVDKNHYAFDDINYLRWHNVVSGDENGNFNPNESVTRAEVVKMLCIVFAVEENNISSFSDVTSNEWYHGYVGGAFEKGLIKGEADGTFNPDKYITRQDLAVLIWRFAVNNGNEFVLKDISFKDGDMISDYARDAVLALTGKGIINGMSDNTFAPLENANRAQIASMLARFMRTAKGSAE